MLPNLEAEQGRKGHADEYVAEKLGLTPQEYGSRKKSGEFRLPEVKTLLKLYDKPFEYLFQTEAGGKGAVKC